MIVSGETTTPLHLVSGQTSSTKANQMHITKRDGSKEPVDPEKIVKAIERRCDGLSEVDPRRVASSAINGIYDGASTQELDRLSIQTAASLIAEDPHYSKLGARLLSGYIDKEVTGQGIHAFSQAVETGHAEGLLNDRLLNFVRKYARKINNSILQSRDDEFEYFGLKTVYDRYLLRHPNTQKVIETPQYFFMRIACALSENVKGAIELYNTFSKLEYLPGSPTLFNAGCVREQLSSCYLLESPQDDLADIYQRYGDIAMLSKYAGGIGLAYHRIRSRHSLIRGTNGKSNGIVPWLKTLDASIAAVNQGGRRKGACCVYLETWHADIEEFLELRDNTGDHASRTHNLNIANWVPDLFMKRVEEDGHWSLFDPKTVPQLVDLYGPEFEAEYQRAENGPLVIKRVKARELYSRMMRTLAQTGNGWMSWKDRCNLLCNQTGKQGNTVHSSNLCEEIVEVTSAQETAVCNLGSVNLARHTKSENGNVTLDFEKLGKTVRSAVVQLDRVIDLNYYPIESAKKSNVSWRPVGLGLMGLQDVFFQMGIPFDSDEAKILSTKISEEIYFNAVSTSADLAEKKKPHPRFVETRAARGDLQFDLWGIAPQNKERWSALKDRVKATGLRNSLLIAIAPTATIASIAGCYECIEPQISNLFKRETLSGDFVQVNKYLIEELKRLGLWNSDMRDKLKLAEGSVQGIAELPENLRNVYRTVWEIPMRSLIDMAASRGPFVDQSQSLNLFVESPSIGKLSSMYFYAWKSGLKTTYYLRSRPATKIAKATVSAVSGVQAVACSLENPGVCSACE